MSLYSTAVSQQILLPKPGFELISEFLKTLIPNRIMPD
jgi:hypothetical protein